jgi:hypothetical protein
MAAAMALAGMNHDELASAAAIARPMLNKILRDGVLAKHATLNNSRRALEVRNIEVTSKQGVRLKSSDVEIYEGPERFESFTNFVFEQIRTHGGDICLSVTDERRFAQYRTNTIEHYQRMQELFDCGVINSFRILANKSNFATKYTYNTYKWQPEKTMARTAFYVCRLSGPRFIRPHNATLCAGRTFCTTGRLLSPRLRHRLGRWQRASKINGGQDVTQVQVSLKDAQHVLQRFEIRLLTGDECLSGPTTHAGST